jgi:hypothetical protein
VNYYLNIGIHQRKFSGSAFLFISLHNASFGVMSPLKMAATASKSGNSRLYFFAKQTTSYAVGIPSITSPI